MATLRCWLFLGLLGFLSLLGSVSGQSGTHFRLPLYYYVADLLRSIRSILLINYQSQPVIYRDPAIETGAD